MALQDNFEDAVGLYQDFISQTRTQNDNDNINVSGFEGGGNGNGNVGQGGATNTPTLQGKVAETKATTAVRENTVVGAARLRTNITPLLNICS